MYQAVPRPPPTASTANAGHIDQEAADDVVHVLSSVAERDRWVLGGLDPHAIFVWV